MKIIYQILIMLELLSLSSMAFSASAEKVFQIASPSVVVVRVSDTKQKPIGLGSGVVVEKNKIITNCHVAEAQSKILLQVEYQGNSYSADVIGQLEEYDLCLLHVNALNAPVASIKRASDLKIGQKVYAIGAPSGFELTLTDGLISSLRQFNDSEIIQTSAAISPGSSGGGLFDDNGLLIGITTFKIKGTEGINFAHLAEHIIELLKMSEMVNSTKALDSQQLKAPTLTFQSVAEGNAWLNEMSLRLQHRIPDTQYREDFLRTLHYEATRAGLDPQLVLAFITVVSGFQKYAVSPKGEGFMRVDKKWIKKIGASDHNLFLLRTNLRYGCTILRYYIDMEKGDLYRALNLYNETPINEASFPNEILNTWRSKWSYKAESIH